MPSTEYFGSTAVNLGPLTTTFTAPSPCATESGFRFFQYVDASNSSLKRAMGASSCGIRTVGSCMPSGDGIDRIRNTMTKQWWYYSPGVACPLGWTTAGTLKGGPEPTGSGVFSGNLNPSQMPLVGIGEYFSNILYENETLALCRPSGWAENVYGSCTSSMGPVTSYSISKYCVEDRLRAPDYGDDWLAHITLSDKTRWSYIQESNTYTRAWTTDDFANWATPYANKSITRPTESIFMETVTPGIRLVYQQSDMEAAAKETEGGGSSLKKSVGVVVPMLLVVLSVLINLS
ncbi:unnamed protein product [Clonostachys solani]|uniref:Uncharacterized protein n=1 Tax=Clonostachys solani TaxID=160281 RepID=A0A9N9YSS4_9HYPO|nr:unnamed protein product [Clonostachys solani]